MVRAMLSVVLQAVIDLAQDGFARQPAAIGSFAHFTVHLGGNHNLVESGLLQLSRIQSVPEVHGNAGFKQQIAVITQGLVELLFAGNALGVVELPADFRSRIKERDVVAALGSDGGETQTGRAGTHDRDAFFRRDR